MSRLSGLHIPEHRRWGVCGVCGRKIGRSLTAGFHTLASYYVRSIFFCTLKLHVTRPRRKDTQAEQILIFLYVMLSSILLLAATALGILMVRALIQAYSSTKRNIPGPFFARFTRLWYLSRIWNRRAHLETIDLHKKHGMHDKTLALPCGTYSFAHSM
jgi:hypothetical protein